MTDLDNLTITRKDLAAQARPGWGISSFALFEPTVTIDQLIAYHRKLAEDLYAQVAKYRFKNGNLKTKGKPLLEQATFHRRAAATLSALPETMRDPLSPMSMASQAPKAEPLRNDHGH